MKNKIILIIAFFFIKLSCYSQKCASQEYLEAYKKSNPQIEQKIKDVIKSFKQSAQHRGVGDGQIPDDQIITIPVVFNVIHYGEAEGTGRNISLGQINDQINILNQAYSGQLGGVDTKIQFCLAQKNIVGLTTTGVYRFLGSKPNYEMGQLALNICFPKFGDDALVKGLMPPGFPSNFFLNIWTTDLKLCNTDDILGYSSSPYIEEGPPIVLDGVVLDYREVGHNVQTNSNGSTAVHEVGHWLGLFHIYDNTTEPCTSTSCENEQDMICDTDDVPSDGIDNIAPGDCLGYNCEGNLTTVVQNFMDYQTSARNNCSRSFTLGQKERMRDVLSFYRTSIYNQNASMSVSSCASVWPGGPGGNGCNASNIPVQKIFPPPQGDVSAFHRKFGGRVELNDKWLVTIDKNLMYRNSGDTETPPGNTDYIRIYKRDGCLYTLYQSIEIGLGYENKYGDYGLQLSNDEIIIGSFWLDSVYVYKYNESSSLWSLNQQIHNSATNEVATSTFTMGSFLFVLESQAPTGNVFRVYHKNANGSYIFHQTISVSGFNLPSSGKYIQAVNLVKSVVNFNSTSFTGSYDPLEILVANQDEDRVLILQLNVNNMWTLSNTIQPSSLQNPERIEDIEVSKDYIHVLTRAQTGQSGSQYDILYIYTYPIAANSLNQFTSGFSKQELYNEANRIWGDHKMEIFNDQFLLVDNISNGLKLFYNYNFFSSNLPTWQSSGGLITCVNRPGFEDDFEVFGNLLVYGHDDYEGLQIFDMKDILPMIGQHETFVPFSDFFDKKVCTIPNNYTTFAEKITIGESCPLQFSQIRKEFIANKSITVMPGITFSAGSIELQVIDIYGACSSIVARPSNIDYESRDLNKVNEFDQHVEFKDVKSRLNIYPNPTKGFVTISARDLKINKVMVTSMEGKTVHTRSNINNYSYDLTLDNFHTGIYLVIVETVDGEVIVDKIIKN